jgi:hypothetical protein
VTDLTILFKRERINGPVPINTTQLAGRAAFQNAESTPSQYGDVVQTPVTTATFDQFVQQWTGAIQ